MPELLHSERLWPSPATWLLVPAAALLLVLALAPLGTGPAAAGALAGAVLVAAFLVRASPVVQVSAADGLRVGRAVVPARFVSGGVAARGEEARQLRGPRLDARSYLCLRGWVDGVVVVHLDDPEDPTPAWVVSSRRPEELLRALLVAAERSGGG